MRLLRVIQVSVKSNIYFPKLKFQDDLIFIAEKKFIPALQTYINRQVQIDGAAYPALEPKTIALKNGLQEKRIASTARSLMEQKTHIAGYGKFVSRKGTTDKSEARSIASGIVGSAKTLIQTGKLLTSFFYKKVGKDTVKITLKDNRLDIGGYLQYDGVGKKKKKFLFFGVSKEMEEEAIKYMAQKITEQLNATK